MKKSLEGQYIQSAVLSWALGLGNTFFGSSTGGGAVNTLVMQPGTKKWQQELPQ